MTINLIFLFLISNLIFATDFTFDKESGKAIPKHIGELKMHKGEVYVQNTSGEFPVKEGAKFFANDVIKTRDKSFAKIMMVDDSVYSIGSNSELKIDHFKYIDKTDRKSVMTVVKGQIRGQIKNKAREGDISIQTRLASMGVRGTEFLVNHQKWDNLNISEFGLIEGTVDVSDQKNLSQKLNKSDRLIVIEETSSGQLLKQQLQLTEMELNQLNNEETFMDFFNPRNINDKSPFYDLVNTHSQKAEAVSSSKKIIDSKSDNWQNNLKKLNQKLREYRK